MAYTNGSTIRKVLIDGVLHPINDYRIEGTNFAVTQIAGSIAVGTPLTTEQLTHITEPVMSADGCVINAPALGTILIPKNVVFNPAATEDYVISYVSSPLEGKTYNLKITMDHTTGLPKEAVFAEEEVAAPPTNILKTKLDTYKTEFAKPVAERDPAIVAEAKVFGNDVLSKKPNIIVELDAEGQPVEVFHATESPDPTAYYRYVNGKNECIDIYYDGSTDPHTTTDLAFPDLENIYVEKAKEYMEIHTTANTVVYKSTKPVMINEDTLGFTQTEEATQGQGVDGIIHYPKSVLITSDSEFTLYMRGTNSSNPGATFGDDYKLEYSTDGLTWNVVNTAGEANSDEFTSAFIPELNTHGVFVRGNTYFNRGSDGCLKKFRCDDYSKEFKVSGMLNAMWGGLSANHSYVAYGLFEDFRLTDAHDLIMPNDVIGEYGYSSLFSNCILLKKAPVFTGKPEGEHCCEVMYYNASALPKPPVYMGGTKVGKDAFTSMFAQCDALTTTMDISNITQVGSGAFVSMYANSGVQNITPLPTITSNSNDVPSGVFEHMFEECKKLVDASNIHININSDTMPNAMCSSMFNGCKELVLPPVLPQCQTIGDKGCHMMFKDCHKLAYIPELPATALGESAYRAMFESCEALVMPYKFNEFTSIGMNAMANMFLNCTGITWTGAGDPQGEDYSIPLAGGAQTELEFIFAGTSGNVPVEGQGHVGSVLTNKIYTIVNPDKPIPPTPPVPEELTCTWGPVWTANTQYDGDEEVYWFNLTNELDCGEGLDQFIDDFLDLAEKVGAPLTIYVSSADGSFNNYEIELKCTMYQPQSSRTDIRFENEQNWAWLQIKFSDSGTEVQFGLVD